MKQLNLIILCIASFFFSISTHAQNVSLNILTQNSGLVDINGIVFLEVTICNTDASVSVPAYKLRPQISIPTAIATIPVTGHNLPSGWAVLATPVLPGGVIRLSNGTDEIPAGACRTILIAIQGTNTGGPSTVTGNMGFSNGNPPGSVAGVATDGDSPSDNSSTSTVEVTNVVPVTLTDLNATLKNCQPALNWTTATEINSDRFEIEKADRNSSNWSTVGTIAARGNSSAKVKYTYIDNNIAASTEKVLYRLKIFSKDGRFKYSEIVPVFINCKTIQVNVFPNPVHNGKLNVSLTGLDISTEASLLSLSGQVVLKMNLSNGTNTVTVSNITNGQYILNVNTQDGNGKRVKVLIQN